MRGRRQRTNPYSCAQVWPDFTGLDARRCQQGGVDWVAEEEIAMSSVAYRVPFVAAVVVACLVILSTLSAHL